MRTRGMLVDADGAKSINDLMRRFETSASALEGLYECILRHPDADETVLQKASALTRKFQQQARRRLRQAQSWQGEREEDAAGWATLIGERPRRFLTMQEVVKQVQLEHRIIKRWQDKHAQPSPLDDRSLDPLCTLSRVNVDCWEAVDVFKLEAETQAPLKQVFMSIWKTRSLGSLSKATHGQMFDFIGAVEASYRDNPYHNRRHAAEVTHCAYYIWSQLAAQDHMKGFFSDLDLLVVALTAAVHDMAHPGTGNDFLVKTEHALAVRYLDRSVLEHFHAASAFALMQDMGAPILQHNLPSPPFETLKGRMVDMLLATDMAQHRRVCEDMASEVAVHTSCQEIDKLKLECHLIHLADIGHPFRPRELHKQWSLLVQDEFFAQGDQEKKLGFTPAPLCDRSKAPALAKSQQGFINFVLVPAWRPMSQVLGRIGAERFESYLNDSQAMWEEMAAEEADKEAAEKGAATKCALGGVASPCRAMAQRLFALQL